MIDSYKDIVDMLINEVNNVLKNKDKETAQKLLQQISSLRKELDLISREIGKLKSKLTRLEKALLTLLSSK